jgi:hypothetical protein
MIRKGLIALACVALAVGALAQNTPNYITQGGSTWGITGILNINATGAVNILSGGTLTLASGSALDLSGALINGVAQGLLNYRGAWSGAAHYYVNDVVTDGGATYACTAAHATSHEPPNGSYWAALSLGAITGGTISLASSLNILDTSGTTAPIAILQTGTSRGVVVPLVAADATRGAIGIYPTGMTIFGSVATGGGQWNIGAGGDELNFDISSDGPSHTQQDYTFYPKRHFDVAPDQSWATLNYHCGSGEGDISFQDNYTADSYLRRSWRHMTGAPKHAFAVCAAAATDPDFLVVPQELFIPDYSRMNATDARRGIMMNAINNTGSVENNALWIGTSATATPATTPTFTVGYNGTFASTASDSSGLDDLLINPAIKTSGNLINLQVGGAAEFRVSYAGTAFANSFNGPTAWLQSQLTLGPGGSVCWYNGSYACDAGLSHPSPGVFKVTNGSTGYGSLDSGGYNVTGAHGETTNVGLPSEYEITLNTGNALTTDTHSLLPANSQIVGVTWYITTTISGGSVTGFEIGLAGGAATYFCGAGSSLASGLSGVCSGQYTNGLWNSATGNVTITTVGGTYPSAGKVRVAVHYIQVTVPTS